MSLNDVIIAPQRLTIDIQTEGDFKHQTEFIGAQGSVLQRSSNNPAVFELHTRENYVRAKVTDSAGRAAWVQPVFTK